MKIAIVRPNSAAEILIRYIKLGDNVRGLRIYSFTVESQQEMSALINPTSEQKEWMHDLYTAFKLSL